MSRQSSKRKEWRKRRRRPSKRGLKEERVSVKVKWNMMMCVFWETLFVRGLVHLSRMRSSSPKWSSKGDILFPSNWSMSPMTFNYLSTLSLLEHTIVMKTNSGRTISRKSKLLATLSNPWKKLISNRVLDLKQNCYQLQQIEKKKKPPKKGRLRFRKLLWHFTDSRWTN